MALDQCVRVAVAAGGGAPILGIEDVAVDRSQQRLLFTAYDRKAVQRAVRNRAFSIPEGGVYAAALSDVLDGDDTAAAISLDSFRAAPGGLRPHGMLFDPVRREIAFVNRSYQKIGGRWVLTPRIERGPADSVAFTPQSEAAPCAANDIVDSGVGGGVLVTFDHGACGWKAMIEDALALKRSGLAAPGGEVVFDGVLYANGAARTNEGEIALAATRERAIVMLKQDATGHMAAARHVLPGGPDNLSVAADGAIIAAVHPSLARLALHRKAGFARAPSRIVRIDPATGAVDILVDDLTGKTFSGATAAVEIDGALVLGSATDHGLLVCRPKA